MKEIFVIVFLYFFSHSINGQSMVDILRLLPKENLREVNIDSLISEKECYVIDDPEQVIKYSLTELDDSLGVLRIEMKFETGQRGFSKTELKTFKNEANECLIVYSVVSGAPVIYGQRELEIYTLKKGQLIKSSKGLLPEEMGLKDFVKPNTPDSIINKYEQYSNHCYELIYFGSNICYVLFEDFEPFGIDKSWLLGDKIEFIFKDGRFKRLPPSFSER